MGAIILNIDSIAWSMGRSRDGDASKTRDLTTASATAPVFASAIWATSSGKEGMGFCVTLNSHNQVMSSMMLLYKNQTHRFSCEACE